VKLITEHRQQQQQQQSVLAGRVVLLKHLKSPQTALCMLKRREANADGDRTFNPVHAESLVQALDHALGGNDVPQ